MDQNYTELHTFWEKFAEFFENRGSLAVIYEQLRLFKEEIAGNYDLRGLRWIMDDMEPTRACMYSNRKFPLPNVGGPVGVSERIRRTGIGTAVGHCWVWNLWFENEEARDAFHAQLPSDHPIITGDITQSNRDRLYDLPQPQYTLEELETDVSRIRLEDLGGR